MKNYLPIISSSHLFNNINENELKAMLNCLDVKLKDYPKETTILHTGDTIDSIGLVLSGTILLIQDDIWGNRNILSKVTVGQSFATAFAFSPNSKLNVDVITETTSTIMYLNVNRILHICPTACIYHNRFIQNLLNEVAKNNLQLNEKLTHMGQRTTKAKLMSYLSTRSQQLNTYEFDIPYSRQELADYLAVDRSGLSLELAKMKKEGLLDYYKNHFILKV